MVPWERYDAVLFDLDGVLTMTMNIHATCWKRIFDDYLRARAEKTTTPFHPFEIANDYKTYVDGKLRYDGVRSFLASRGICLPDGSPQDPPDKETVCGLGNRKDRMVGETIDREGVEVLEGSLEVVHHVRGLGIRTAVVSASKNCRTVLRAAGIESLFERIIDGDVAARRGLPGKPRPDTFLAAAEELGVAPARAVVVEDAVSGVQAGRAGGFGLVIGIDHHGDRTSLLESGVDIVVEDLAETLAT